MKTTLALLAITFALVSDVLHAQQEIVTLTWTDADNDNSFRPLDPDSLIEVLTVAIPPQTTADVNFRWPDGRETLLRNIQNIKQSVILRGVSGVRLTIPSRASDVHALTLRITPEGTTPLVSEPIAVPVTSGNALLSIEASTDMTTWFPAGEGEIPAESPARFFRLKAVVSE